MQETKEQIQIYSLFQKLVYLVVLLECAILFYINSDIPILPKILLAFKNMNMFSPNLNAKFVELFLIVFVAIGTKAKKKQDLNIIKSILIPIVIGLILMFGSLQLIDYTFDKNSKIIFPHTNTYQLAYFIVSLLGALITMVGADNISKLIKTKLGKDRWNIEEESFDQTKELVETDTSINIPYQFYFKKKINDGWLNINPFRGSLIIGTPGSGKSFSIINPTIRQMVAKGFSMCIYDFKYPQLGEIAYYHYLQKKKKDKNYKHNFLILNLNDVERSERVNPINKKYLPTLAHVQEISTSIVSALSKGSSKGGGADTFFFQSAVNLLSACIGFLAFYENGKYSTIPHLLALLNKSYEEIFDTLFVEEEIESLLSPFKSSYENRSYETLDSQIGTLKIQLSVLASKESFWVFSPEKDKDGNELGINLKLSDKNDPTILILASDPSTQDTSSALYSSVLNRMLSLVNNKGNYPMGLIADEFPTIYIHKVDNLIATARSNKVAVMLGMQELPQLKQYYNKDTADTIVSIIGNLFSGSVRDKATLDWQEKIYGKVKQQSQSIQVNQNQTSITTNERMDYLIPAGKIASLRTAEMVGIIAKDASSFQAREYETSVFNGKINLDMKAIQHEEANYPKMPSYYSFKDANGKDIKDEVLKANFRKIKKEVDLIVAKHKRQSVKKK